MTRARSTIVVLLVGAALMTSSRPAAAQARDREIFASALDRNGVPVPSLGPSDFVVREDKVAREVLRVTPADEPMDIAVLVDNSQFSEQYIRDYREALVAFINTVAEDNVRHQVAIITVAERPTINTDYTLDLSRAVQGAERIFAMPGSGAYLLDGIIETSQGIIRREPSRPVIVAISTEGPELSDRQYQTVLEPLRASGAALHVIVVGRPLNNSTDRAIVLDVGTRESGGNYDNLLTGNALTARLKRLATELTSQYRVTYARPESLIPPEQVTIAAARPGLTVRGTPARQPRDRQ
jgi:hypothetical protein